jgi:hypothetical protein
VPLTFVLIPDTNITDNLLEEEATILPPLPAKDNDTDQKMLLSARDGEAEGGGGAEGGDVHRAHTSGFCGGF